MSYIDKAELKVRLSKVTLSTLSVEEELAE